jgi:hypothetical protein
VRESTPPGEKNWYSETSFKVDGEKEDIRVSIILVSRNTPFGDGASPLSELDPKNERPDFQPGDSANRHSRPP